VTAQYLGPLYLSAAASIWGGLYVASKFALDTIPPFTLLFFRYLVAAIVLVMICMRTNTKILPTDNRLTLFQIGFFGYFLSVASQFIGTKLSSAHMGAVITTLSPVFQSGFAIWLLREHITLRQAIAILLSLGGVLTINGLPGTQTGVNLQIGAFFLLLAALLWGYYSVLAKKVSTAYSALQITTIGIIIATLCTFPAALNETNGLSVQSFSWPIIFSILYLGVCSTAIAFFCWNKGLTLVPSHHAGLFFFLQPLVGSFLSWALLDEHLSNSFFIGSLLILVGVYFVMSEKSAESHPDCDTKNLESPQNSHS